MKRRYILSEIINSLQTKKYILKEEYCQVFDSYVRYLSYDLLVIAEMPNYELTSNHTLSLPPLHL